MINPYKQQQDNIIKNAIKNKGIRPGAKQKGLYQTNAFYHYAEENRKNQNMKNALIATKKEHNYKSKKQKKKNHGH